MILYDFVPFHFVAVEIENNLTKHYEDVSLKDNYGKPNLDWDTYIQLSMADRCKVVTARDNGRLVAYSAFCISNNLNHRTNIEAANTGIFIERSYRGKITLELIRKSDEYLKGIGVMETTYVLLDDRIGALLKRAKYKAKHILWSSQYATISNTIT